ncbi:MAG: 3-oxoacyl-ACP synthase [candidate division Zixibacteria bacterium CG_4_9_14_3_um_filter_46_8]|nr:MAG: 3-oxoacyl-ACP synthase [candidate division Zixibacteria bacterium CG_4_9_14_3_um_filter_46_8]
MSERYYAEIVGTGHAVPERILTNFDLEKMVDTSDEWIVSRTGIRERHIADENTYASTLGTKAAISAMEMAGIGADDLELILVATVTPDMPFPSTAAIIQKNLNAPKTAVMDISAGCTGFIYGLSIVDSYIKTGIFKTVLLLGVEVLSKITDWTDRSTCILFGDGAGAVIIRATLERKGILGTYIKGDGRLGGLLMMPGGGSQNPASKESVDGRLHYLKMSGNEVFKFAVQAMGEASTTILEQTGLKAEEIGTLVPHQANIRIIQATAKRLHIPPEKVYVNIDRYGNTSSASIPIALDEIRSNGNYKAASPLLLVAFGAGFTWGSAAITW